MKVFGGNFRLWVSIVSRVKTNTILQQPVIRERVWAAYVGVASNGELHVGEPGPKATPRELAKLHVPGLDSS